MSCPLSYGWGMTVDSERMTVGQLMECLQMFSSEVPVVALYDCRCAAGALVGVEVGRGPEPGDQSESVVLVIE